MSFATERSAWKRCGEMLLLAAAYVLAGRIALLLAVPPGYAMAVYPPAGIALGFVLIRGYGLAPGVALGSFVLNLWIGWDTRGVLSLSSCALPAALGAGAALQAICGAWLARRFVGYPTALDKEWDILVFLFLSGPVASLINASVGVGSLLAAGIVTPANALSNWATWWIGDTLGVLVLAPLLLIAFGVPRRIWWARRFRVGVPLLVSLSAVVFAFASVRNMELERKHREFREEAGRMAQLLQTRLGFHSEMVKILERLFASSDEVTREDFHTFVSPAQARYPTLQALEWAPLVTAPQRSQFEKTVRQQTGGAFEITERAPDGGMVRAADRASYFPVMYVEPAAGNARARGFDVGSTADRRRALEIARDTGLAVASEPIALVQGGVESNQVGGLLFAAVYERGAPLGSVEQRRRAFRGVVLSAIRIDRLIRLIFSDDQRDQIRFRMSDAASGSANAVLYDTIGHGGGDRPALTAKIVFGEREYAFMAQPSSAYWERHRSWAAWWMLVGGLLFTSLLGTYLLIVSAQAYRVETLVRLRTRELQESEDRLKANGALLQTVMDSMSSCVDVRDTDGRFLYVNKEFERVFGDGTPALVGRSADEIFPPQLAARFREGEQAVTHGRAAAQSEIELRQDDGSHTYLVVRSPVLADDGRVSGTCGVATDITQRIRDNEALHENMMLLEAVMQSTSSAVVVRDIDGTVIYANREYVRLFSPDGMAVVGRNIKDIFDAGIANELLESGRPVIQQGLTTRAEIAVERDGAQYTHLLVRSPLRNERGEIYGLCGVATDITQNKQTEDDMRRLNRQLEATTSLQKAILNSANFSIISSDVDGVIQVFNLGAQKMLGYTAAEMVGMRTPVILHVPDEVRARAALLTQETGRRIEPGFEVFVARARGGVPDEQEWTFVRKDGTRFPVMLSMTALWNDKHELTGFLGVAYDLTERKKIENMKNEFIATVSHELRTPLTSIHGALDLLVAGTVGQIEPDVRRLLEIADEDCGRLVRLVNDILDIEKIESGNMRFELSVQPLLPLIEQAITVTESFAAQHKVRFSLQADAGAACAAVDADRIIQVLVNLLSNAVKYSPPDSTVRVRVARRADRVRVSVSDQGDGVAEEFHNRIFEKFAQADSSDSRLKGGTGLGLNICREIIERHRGRIDFHSTPGVGSEFYFELALADATAAFTV